MTKYRLLLIASLPLLIAVALGVLATLPRSHVTKANFDRIQEGMTKAEVEQIFGEKGKWDAETDRLVWQADDGTWACVWFIDGCVTQTNWLNPNETLLEKIRRWLHLR